MNDRSDEPTGAMPFDSNSILPTSDRWLRWSSLALLSGCGLGLALVNTLQVDVTVRAYGQIRPVDPPHQVTAPIAGAIATLHASDNQAVSAGQPLFDLRPYNGSLGDGLNPETVPEDELPTPIHTVRAPINGFVLGMASLNPGQPVQRGSVVTEIMPPPKSLVVKALVSPTEIGQIQLGSPVQMQVSAYPYPEYGTLAGTVLTVSPDTVLCQLSHCPTPEGYMVEIELQRIHMEAKSGQRHKLQPGMGVTADIVTQREKLLTLILQKLRLTQP
ncbi:MAG: HlyD family efflux transporter periplasmic adaptor subunit [Cyanothece sp. SIO2G6]|nr:HlyD family efflux transporter periplasmic adaptor subunit [Cyanothece sp. SIO2G6]